MNQLKHKAKFEQILQDYKPDSTVISKLEVTKFCFLVSPTASGRNTIINQVVEDEDFIYIPSDTTRKMRINNGIKEENGKEYFFISEDEFLERLQNNEYLEAAVVHNQQVSGINLKRLFNDENKIKLGEIETRGAENINLILPDADLVFVLPPGFNEWMNRLEKRGNISELEKQNRLKSARQELQAAFDRDYYKFLINRDYNRAAQKLIKYLKYGDPLEDEATARNLAKSLLEKLESKIK